MSERGKRRHARRGRAERERARAARVSVKDLRLAEDAARRLAPARPAAVRVPPKARLSDMNLLEVSLVPAESVPPAQRFRLVQPAELTAEERALAEDAAERLRPAPGTISFNVNGREETIHVPEDPSAMTVSGVADAINAAGLGLTASVVGPPDRPALSIGGYSMGCSSLVFEPPAEDP